MKKLVLSAMVLVGLGLAAQAQCDKKVTWTGSKAVFLDAEGNEQRTEESPITIITTNKTIFITHGDDPNDKINADVTEYACNWKEAYKNGKTNYKASFYNGNGEARDGTVEIEGKDGKLVFTLAFDQQEGRKIQVVLETHKEE